MRLFFVLAVMLFDNTGSNLRAQTSLAEDAAQDSAEDRLLRSADALRKFGQSAQEPVKTLLEKALCIGVAPRRGRGQSGAGEKGFVSCRPIQSGVWSNPAAILIDGGGTFWPVVGAEIDLIILTTNQSAASHFGDREETLGSPHLATIPGPVRTDQAPLRNIYPVIFAYQQSTGGIGGINIAGAAMTEDKAANTTLYGRELSNMSILNQHGGERSSIAVDLFLSALSSSTSGESDTESAAQ